MNFVAIDVETANADLASICQIGLVVCEGGETRSEWKTYVDPEDYFDSINVAIHGIDEAAVRGAPKFAQIIETLREYMDDAVAVCHTHFDRVALQQACQRSAVAMPSCSWLDSARVARRAWSECAWKGYGLYSVCRMLRYDFAHHDALEDAKAAAHILHCAARETGLDVEGWLKRVEQPIDPTASAADSRVARAGNPEGDLYGEVLVFTGTLRMPLREAADLATAIGCQVAGGVTKKTTLLVVGDQDVKKLAGHSKSAKHRRAEELIGQGHAITILRESDFRELIRATDQ